MHHIQCVWHALIKAVPPGASALMVAMVDTCARHPKTVPSTVSCTAPSTAPQLIHPVAFAWTQVKEFDRPNALLQDSGSMFNKLVEDTGPVASSMLRQMAAAGPQDDGGTLSNR